MGRSDRVWLLFREPVAGFDSSVTRSRTTIAIASSTNTTRLMINTGTGNESVPPDLDVGGDDQRRPRRRLWWVLGGIGVLLVVLGVGSALIQVPYYALSPGSVWPTTDLVEVEGAESYDSDGEIGFTTVSLRHASALEAVIGWLDPSIRVVPEDEILGDQTPRENRERNLAFMADSKSQATAVALDVLGYEVIESDGARVLAVDETVPAAEVLEPGDVVMAFDGEVIDTREALVEAVLARSPGETVILTVERFEAEPGETEEVEAVLTSMDDDPEVALLGVHIDTRATLDFPFDVTIDSGDVGGPSAGLAFTLAVLESLTPEELTGGQFVATTGTIDLDGHVGPVGGVAQKTVAARRAGVDVFIVPGVEYDEAVAHAGDMRVEAADTVEDAVVVLGSIGGDTRALGTPTESASGG